LALELAGLGVAKNYYNSMREWCADETAPLAKPKPQKQKRP